MSMNCFSAHLFSNSHPFSKFPQKPFFPTEPPHGLRSHQSHHLIILSPLSNFQVIVLRLSPTATLCRLIACSLPLRSAVFLSLSLERSFLISPQSSLFCRVSSQQAQQPEPEWCAVLLCDLMFCFEEEKRHTASLHTPLSHHQQRPCHQTPPVG